MYQWVQYNTVFFSFNSVGDFTHTRPRLHTPTSRKRTHPIGTIRIRLHGWREGVYIGCIKQLFILFITVITCIRRGLCKAFQDGVTVCMSYVSVTCPLPPPPPPPAWLVIVSTALGVFAMRRYPHSSSPASASLIILSLTLPSSPLVKEQRTRQSKFYLVYDQLVCMCTS